MSAVALFSGAEASPRRQLLAAMTAEIAIRELDAGRRLPGARRALRRFLGASLGLLASSALVALDPP